MDIALRAFGNYDKLQQWYYYPYYIVQRVIHVKVISTTGGVVVVEC